MLTRVGDVKSGLLDSPYGGIRMIFDGRWWPNGTKIVNNRIEAETLEHRVPDHWIKSDEKEAKC